MTAPSGFPAQTFVFVPKATPFQQQILTGLNGTTFQITDGVGKTVVFEFLDSASIPRGNRRRHVSSLQIDDRYDRFHPRRHGSAAINTAGLACEWRVAQSDGSILLSGLNVILDLGQTPFLSVGSTNQGANFQFVDTSIANNQASSGNIPIDYDSTTDTIDVIRNDMVLAINGGTVITGIDAANVPTLAGLNGETFQVTDNTGKQLAFQFIDSSGTTALSAGDLEISYNSATDTIADVSDDLLAAINASGLAVTATNVSSGIAIAGTDVAFTAGTTPFQSTVVAGLSFGVTAQARPDGETFVTGVDSAHILNLATLDGESFQIADSKGNQVSFQFIDTSGTTALRRATWKSRTTRRRIRSRR